MIFIFIIGTLAGLFAAIAYLYADRPIIAALAWCGAAMAAAAFLNYSTAYITAIGMAVFAGTLLWASSLNATIKYKQIKCLGVIPLFFMLELLGVGVALSFAQCFSDAKRYKVLYAFGIGAATAYRLGKGF